MTRGQLAKFSGNWWRCNCFGRVVMSFLYQRLKPRFAALAAAANTLGYSAGDSAMPYDAGSEARFAAFFAARFSLNSSIIA